MHGVPVVKLKAISFKMRLIKLRGRIILDLIAYFRLTCGAISKSKQCAGIILKVNTVLGLLREWVVDCCYVVKEKHGERVKTRKCTAFENLQTIKIQKCYFLSYLQEQKNTNDDANHP